MPAYEGPAPLLQHFFSRADPNRQLLMCQSRKSPQSLVTAVKLLDGSCDGGTTWQAEFASYVRTVEKPKPSGFEGEEATRRSSHRFAR